MKSGQRKSRWRPGGAAGGWFGLLAALALGLPVSPASAVNPVSDPVQDLGLRFVIAPWVRVPDGVRGPARLDAMALAGERMFVTDDLDGRIFEIVSGEDGPRARLFFNLELAIPANTGRRLDNGSMLHGGLRGLAFHPDFDENGRFYTAVMEARPPDPSGSVYLSDPSDPSVADSVLIEWRVDPETGEVDRRSYREVFRVGIPFFDHPIKQIAFDPLAAPGSEEYGLLYIGHGDGNVQAEASGMDADALGKVLRIDPLEQADAPYRVPPGNPFVGEPSMPDEVFSLGHRNPHHFAFVRDALGRRHLLVAEPGRDNVDEVNLLVAGGNYGWSAREGTFVHRESGGLVDGVAPLPDDDAAHGYIYPAAQIGHHGPRGAGYLFQAVAGGHVVANGSELSGHYFYSDFPRGGRVFHSPLEELVAAVTSLDPEDPARDQPEELTRAPVGRVAIWFDHDADPATPPIEKANLRDVIDDAETYDGSGRADVRFGLGPRGELYVMNKHNGWIYRVLNSEPR